MSEDAKQWAFKVGGITSAEKLTLMMIADSFDDEQGISSIPMSDLSAFTCMSKRNLQRVVKSLQEKSLIQYESTNDVLTKGNVRNVPFRDYRLPLYEVSA
jgi:DNA-binding MarR family transcriptional regulator